VEGNAVTWGGRGGGRKNLQISWKKCANAGKVEVPICEFVTLTGDKPGVRIKKLNNRGRSLFLVGAAATIDRFSWKKNYKRKVTRTSKNKNKKGQYVGRGVSKSSIKKPRETRKARATKLKGSKIIGPSPQPSSRRVVRGEKV